MNSASRKAMATHLKQGECRERWADVSDDDSDYISPFFSDSPLIHQRPQKQSCHMTTDLEHRDDSDEGPAEKCKSEEHTRHYEKHFQQYDEQFQYIILQNLPARYNHERLAQDLVERDENRFAVAFHLPGYLKPEQDKKKQKTVWRFNNPGYAFVALDVQSHADANTFLNVFNGWNWKKMAIDDKKRCKAAVANRQELDPKKGWRFISEFAGTTTRV